MIASTEICFTRWNKGKPRGQQTPLGLKEPELYLFDLSLPKRREISLFTILPVIINKGATTYLRC